MIRLLATLDRPATGCLWIGFLTLAVYLPTTGYPFLQVAFDDPGFVSENPAIGPFSWERLWLCFSTFTLYDYLPLPMVSYLLDYQFWGTWAGGYHLTNVLLHVIVAWLVQAWVTRVAGDRRVGTIAGLLFALHPLQVEAVAIVAQRKTLLSTLFLLLALLAYDRYLRTATNRRAYVSSLLAYAAACLSKSSVTPFPLMLLWYERWFSPHPVRYRDKLPFFLLAGLTAAVSLYAKWGEVVKPAHGDAATTLLLMGRVWWDYIMSFFLPLDLAPAYYYRRASVHSLRSVVAVFAALALLLWLWRRGRAWPNLSFWLGWTALALLPVSNVIPLAVVRADRYLYVPMVGFAWFAARAVQDIERQVRLSGWNPSPGWAGAVVAALAALLSAAYLPVFRDDVAARQWAVERHPWAAPAHYLLAVAYREQGNRAAARRAAHAALQQDPQFTRAHQLLAQLYEQEGNAEQAAFHARAAMQEAGAER